MAAHERTWIELIADLHIHTNSSSYCSSLSPHEMFEAAGRLGLDALAVTEHSTHHGASIAYEIGREMGFMVFRGMEVYTKSGDMLVFGVQAEIEPDMDFEELLDVVKKERGVVIAAHPTRGYWGHHRRYKGFPSREVLEQVDAIETLNGCCTYQMNVQSTRLAAELGLPQVGGSDAHDASQVGKCITVFPRDVKGEEDLVSMIREGLCKAAYLEDAAARPGGGMTVA